MKHVLIGFQWDLPVLGEDCVPMPPVEKKSPEVGIQEKLTTLGSGIPPNMDAEN